VRDFQTGPYSEPPKGFFFFFFNISWFVKNADVKCEIVSLSTTF
jgi:hypothetical protein